MSKLRNYLKLIRVHHYIKNMLIFLPIIFSSNLFNLNILFKTILGFISFSFIASVIYVINDIVDVEKDKLHNVKCKRPFPSGAVSIAEGKVIIVLLFVIAWLIEFYIAKESILSHMYLLLYFIINILYSFKLKNVPIVDIFILVSGFLLRVLYGSSITGIEISNWLYLTVISFSFYMSLGKRRNEIIKQGDKSREVLKYYTHNFLDKNMYMCLSLSIAFYALWSMSETTIAKINGNYTVMTVPIVMLIALRYSYNIESNSYGDPIDVIIHDWVLIFLVLIYSIFIFSIIYII